MLTTFPVIDQLFSAVHSKGTDKHNSSRHQTNLLHYVNLRAWAFISNFLEPAKRCSHCLLCFLNKTLKLAFIESWRDSFSACAPLFGSVCKKYRVSRETVSSVTSLRMLVKVLVLGGIHCLNNFHVTNPDVW